MNTTTVIALADASKVPLAAARHDLPLSSRLLGIGLPLLMSPVSGGCWTSSAG